ncbi:hypothetical protein [Krasilnikovia sp. MM14-A1259]|uniref:hypothetical protein n=1 Tax=Krasilnikovia sp. MM14-A1259 TaxID=3373539 RepID=UPI0037F9CFC7
MGTERTPFPELDLLQKFEDRMGGKYFAEGFELTEYADTADLAAGFSADPEFLRRLIAFAQAGQDGSSYALWLVDDGADPATVPVVVFGGEGGCHVIARNFRELLQLLGHDSEPMVDWDEVFFVRDEEDYEPSDGHDDYVSWLREQFGLAPADDPAAIVAAAQAEFGERFSTWISPFQPA